VSRPRLIHLVSVEQLRDAAVMWDDLWWRSHVTRPTVRAEMVAQWLEQFSRPGDFHALVVEDQGQWVAALPLVRSSRSRLLSTGGITSNEWSSNGDLLLDPCAPVNAVLEVLVAGMREVPWQLLWLNEVPLDAPRWVALRRAIDRAAVASDHHEQTEVGLIEIRDDWQAFQRSLSKKHRHNMGRCNRRLAEQGEVWVEMLSQLDSDQLEPCLRKAFEIEDRSWKGEAGTSVLRVPGMFDFFFRQARQLAQWDQLELAFLYCGQEPVAFSYGYTAKGVSHWHKIGYEPQLHAGPTVAVAAPPKISLPGGVPSGRHHGPLDPRPCQVEPDSLPDRPLDDCAAPADRTAGALRLQALGTVSASPPRRKEQPRFTEKDR
jgi:CelD/BcsL family acetyltransferase involved in cellulose biosynthesis